MKHAEVASNKPDLGLLLEALAFAVTRTPPGHAVLCVHVCGLPSHVAANLNAALLQLAPRSGGPAMLTEVSVGDFVLFMPDWPRGRARQVARVIRAAAQRDWTAGDGNIRIGLLPIHIDTYDIETLPAIVDRFCTADSVVQSDDPFVEVISLHGLELSGDQSQRTATATGIIQGIRRGVR
jgi:hypothetical protein